MEDFETRARVELLTRRIETLVGLVKDLSVLVVELSKQHVKAVEVFTQAVRELK